MLMLLNNPMCQNFNKYTYTGVTKLQTYANDRTIYSKLKQWSMANEQINK